jgi:hypothetical protein
MDQGHLLKLFKKTRTYDVCYAERTASSGATDLGEVLRAQRPDADTQRWVTLFLVDALMLHELSVSIRSLRSRYCSTELFEHVA